MNSTTLFVLQHDRNELPNSATGETIVVNDVLKKVSEERMYELIETFLDTSICGPSGFSSYDLIKHYRIAIPSPKYSLVLSLLLYEELASVVESGEIAEIRCGDLHEFYQPVIRDLCDNYDISLPRASRTTRTPVREYVSALAQSWDTVADVTLSALGNLVGRSDEDADTIFFLRPDRLGTLRPVLERVDDTPALYDTAHRHPLSPGQPASTPDECSSRSLHSLATVTDLIEILRYVTYGLPLDLFSSDGIQTQLCDHIEAAVGARLEQTASYATQKLSSKTIYAKVWSTLARRLFRVTDCDRIVLNAIGVAEIALLLAADDDVETYLVPHGTVNGYEATIPSGTTRFVAGDPEKQHLHDLPYVSEQQDVVVTGLPKLSEYYQQYGEDSITTSDGDVEIALMTQPVEDGVRRQFVSTVLRSLQTASADYDPIIKTHPDETTSFYAEYIEKMGLTASVVDDDLVPRLRSADLVVTIYSNTALEAITVGTPCLSVNPWRPFIPAKPFITGGPIPLLESPSAVTSFFDGLDRTKLNEMYAEQISYLHETYNIDGRPAAEIVAHIFDP